MATQSDLAGLDPKGEHEHNMSEAYGFQDQQLSNEQARWSPTHARGQDELALQISPQHPQEETFGSFGHDPGSAATRVDFVPVDNAGSDAFDADMLSNLQVFSKPPPLQARQPTGNYNESLPLQGEGLAVPELTHDGNAHDAEGATMASAQDANSIKASHEKHLQDYQEVNMHTAEHDTERPQHQAHEVAPPAEKRKKRRLRRKRLPEPTPIQPEDMNLDASLDIPPHASAILQNHDAARAQVESGGPGGSRPRQTQEAYGDTRPDSPHFQLQNEMRAAAVEEGRYRHEHHDSQNYFPQNVRLQQHDQQAPPAMYDQYFQPEQNRYGPLEMRLNHAGDMPPDQCPSSDILGDAAQEFEHRIYRKQQAKSAKHQAERNAWQQDLRHELQAKQTLQDRLQALQQEKNELTAAIEKQKAKVAGFETTANKLKTFIGGLANDMGVLRRDASSHRQDCSNVGEEAKEHKVALDSLLQQLAGNAEKSSQLKNEALKACRSAKSELSAATMRADHLQEQLNEKTVLLAEEKSLREQIQSQVTSAANSGDAMLRMLKSNEQSLLDKLSAIAASVAEAGSGEAISEQLGKTLAAVQGLNSQQAVTVNDIVSVKGIVEQMAESLKERPDDMQHQTDQESALKTLIDEALTRLKSDLCQQEKLAVQDATNREAISGLQSKIEDVNARMAECNSNLSTTRASEAQLKEQNVSLEAKIVTLQSQVTTGERDAAQLVQLKVELGLKVTALQTTKSEIDKKTNDLRKLTAANEELRSQISALELRLQQVPAVVTFDTELTELEEKHRKHIESVREEAKNVAEQHEESERARAENEIKQLKDDNSTLSTRFERVTKDLETSKKRLEDLQSKDQIITDMQERIDSATELASDRKKEVDVLKLNLTESQHTGEEVTQLQSQLANARETARKAVQEKDSLIEQTRRTRREWEETEERLNQQLRQCHTDSKEMERRLTMEVHVAEEQGEAATKQMQDSAEEAIAAEKAIHVKQVQALQKSLQDLRTDLQSRIETDEGFREELQRSWQNEEKNNQDKISELNDKILEAETQRDEAVAQNEQLREDLAKIHKPAAPMALAAPKESTRAGTQPTEIADSSDPRLQNRRPHEGDRSALQDTTQLPEGSRPKKTVVRRVIEPAVPYGTNETHSSDRAHGPVVEESQEEPPHNSQHRSLQPLPRELVAGESQQSLYQTQQEREPVVEESQQRSYSTFGDTRKASAQHHLDVDQNEQHRDSVVEESQQQSYSTSREQQNEKHGRRGQHNERRQQESSYYSSNYTNITSPVIEASQQTSFPFGQNRGPRQQNSSQSYITVSPGKPLGSRPEAEGGTQVVPETQYESDMPVGMPSFAAFNATSTMRRGRQHEIASTAFEDPPFRAGTQAQPNAPRNFRKSMPPPNTASRMVHPGTDSSSLSSLSQEEINSLASTARPKMFSTAGTKYKTPEPRSLGGKAHPSQSVSSASSPNFVEQMANGRSQNTYRHSGGSGKKTAHHHSNHKEPRAAAPKRKAEAQVVQGYEQERRKKQYNRSSQGDGLTRSSQGEGHALSELVASQNRMAQAPSSSRGDPRTSTQPSRMQTLAGATSSSITRQTRNSTRKLTKNEEMNARFEREINSAR